jgi:transposase
MSMPYSPVTDEQWEIISFYIPDQERGRPRTRDREIFNAIMYVLYNQSRWAELPDYFPPKSTVHKRFQVWSKAGFFDKLLRHLGKRLPESNVYHLDSALRMAKKGESKSLGQSGPGVLK